VSYRTITVETREHIAELRLNRPSNGNPIDDDFLDELDAAAAAIHDDASVYVVLLSAAGSMFSSGEPPESELLLPRDRFPFRSLETLGQPVIAVIEGDALGAGFALTLACDVRIASEDAWFTALGAGSRTPWFGAPVRLPRLAGRGLAAELLLLGTRIDSRRAAQAGLMNEALPAPQVRARAEELAARMAAQGPIALRYAKEAMLQGLDLPLEAALRYETDLTVILQTTFDRSEGVRAFLGKRPPRFEGR
jgi:enoyl-CoA hydratase